MEDTTVKPAKKKNRCGMGDKTAKAVRRICIGLSWIVYFGVIAGTIVAIVMSLLNYSKSKNHLNLITI